MSAGAASAAARTIAAAGTLPRFFIPDHAADQQADDQGEYGDQNDIDQVGGKPWNHFDHILLKKRQSAEGEGSFPQHPADRRGERLRSFHGKRLGFLIGLEELPAQ